MKEKTTQGIILTHIPYLHRSIILKIFSPHLGMASFILKNVGGKKASLRSLASSLNRVEISYRKGKNDLYLILDMSMMDFHLLLRKSYLHISVAGKIGKSLLLSQLPEKSAPKLYDLILSSFKKLPEHPFPESLLYAFQLKLLHHEGLLRIQNTCSKCFRKSSRIYLGESFCQEHGKYGVPFNEDEWNLLNALIQKTDEPNITSAPFLAKKLENLFQSLIRL